MTAVKKPAVKKAPLAPIATIQAPVIKDAPEEQKEFIVGVHKVTATTKLKYKANPKRKNSKAWSRYESYQKARTFAQYQKLNKDKQSIPDLKYDLSKGFVEIA